MQLRATWPLALRLRTPILVTCQSTAPPGLDAERDSEEEHTHAHAHMYTWPRPPRTNRSRGREGDAQGEKVRLERPEGGKSNEGQKGLKASGTPAKAKPKGLGCQDGVVPPRGLGREAVLALPVICSEN